MQVRRTAVCLAILAIVLAIGYFFGTVAAVGCLALMISVAVLFVVRSRASGSEPKRIVTPNERRHSDSPYSYRDRWPGEPPHR